MMHYYFLLFFLGLFSFNITVCANPMPHSDRNKNFDTFTFNIKETSYIQTDNYIWNAQISPIPNSAEWSVKLLNPHPKLQMLNLRINELPKDQELIKHIKQTIEDRNKLLPLNIQKQNPNFKPKDEFHLVVQFLPHASYERKPRFSTQNSISTDDFKELCNQQATVPNFNSKLINPQDRMLQLSINLDVDTQGQIQSIQIQPNIDELPKLKGLIQSTFKKATFITTLDENGRPTSFKTEQPLEIRCPPFESSTSLD